ncbi:hypothetical protein A7982_13247 [Minicystis rosea]|nr:hypothetical protein A7982_13247 [Minicystis rosea]
MAKLSTSAWILHDLGMAAGFGGSLFGKAALDPAAKAIGSREERGRVLDDAWGRFRVLDAVALGAMAATWLNGRKAFSRPWTDPTTRALVVAKDILVGGAVVTGAANLVAGMVMHRQQRKSGKQNAPLGAVEAAPPLSKEQGPVRFFSIVGPLNAAFTAGAIGVTAALSQRTSRSRSYQMLSRLLG